MRTSSVLLRIGLAFTLIYAGIAAWLNPTAWVGFFPAWLIDLISAEIVLKLHSVGGLVLGLWLLSGWRVVYPAAITALFMAALVAFNFGAMDIVFRDVGLFFMALSLAFLSKSSEALGEK